ncbi:MAG TPA: hypothetical protein VGI39_31795 [Polyangiaceae bacterium]|jgi:hypothetical protein
MRANTILLAAFVSMATVAAACSPAPQKAAPGEPASAPETTADAGSLDDLHGTIGAQGGELWGPTGSAFAGVHVVIPPGALTADTDIHVTLSTDTTPLPPAARRCGPIFAIGPTDVALAIPATVTLPFDESIVSGSDRFDDEVKVWVRSGAQWGQKKQIDSTPGTVTIELPSFTDVAAGVNPPKPADYARFKLVPNPKFVRCLAAYPDDPKRQPVADVIVVRGTLNDSLTLRASYLKPGLNFDMFTVEHSSLKADKTPDPAFTNFGLAWYQSDLDSRDDGGARVNVRTILLDQIFGFDPAATLPPTSTLHLGFWFNDPKDAAACGFDVTKPTPFNGEHQAGPLAMITVPDATTNLGPLCTNPDTSVTPARCSP